MSLLGMKLMAAMPTSAARALCTAGMDFEAIINSSDSADTSALDGLVEKTEGVGWSVNRLVVTVIVILFVIGGIVAAGRLFFMSPQERQDAKTSMIWKAIAVVGVAAVPALILLLTSVGKNLFG
ncbi:hypothetical protein [Butyrivibrio hungatei]|uniref:TrbC/VIRB2 family protein n=1 Tax=Butyrivibrio hungatei TaxID=185008 RepID=A0A1D9P5L7_9FIRM|nr:hypothetical protein [Butyrivibrio hungatei]AOZ97831.1 hypothetical protein bhn_II032 [Butyrivibrio hungatei]